MRRAGRASGGGIPTGWMAKDAIAAADIRRQSVQTFFTSSSPPDENSEPEIQFRTLSFSLVGGLAQTQELVTSGNWPARDQAHRGTCNAFAFVAAAELIAWQETGVLPRYSEEQLYTVTRNQPLAGLASSQADVNAIKDAGTTFLQQVRDAVLSDQPALVLGNEGEYRTDGDLPVNHEEPTKPSPTVVDISHWSFKHDIYVAAVNSGDPVWRGDTPQDTTLQELFLSQLQQGNPVVASFPILPGRGRRAFTAGPARRLGITSFPDGVTFGADEPAPLGGHTVCLTGYVDDPQPSAPDFGWFIFRNSYGERLFGCDVEESPLATRGPMRGYGVISSTDLEAYCWEYLYRDLAA